MKRYRFFIAEEGERKHLKHVRTSYHYQATETSLSRLWERIDTQIQHYNAQHKDRVFLQNSVRRDLKAAQICSAVKPCDIGESRSGKIHLYIQWCNL